MIMSVNIGNNNKIINSNISETIEDGDNSKKPHKKRFFDRHPVICGFFISLIAGLFLMFSFWKEIIAFIEGLF